VHKYFNLSIVDEIKLPGLPFVLKCLLDLRYKLSVLVLEVSSCSATALPPISSIQRQHFFATSLLRYVTMTSTPFLRQSIFLPNPRRSCYQRDFVVSCAIVYSFFITFFGIVSHRVEKSGFKYTNLHYCLTSCDKLLTRKNILYNERMRTVKSARHGD